MKNLLLAIILIAASISGFTQSVAINTTGNAPNPRAILDISSQDRGILIPRMTTEDREAIPGPPMGLLVFDTDKKSFWFYTTVWNEIIGGDDLGTAGGDLMGEYPEPIVAKLQGHAVDSLTPEDKQVLKWDASTNMWKGMNDSLTLPYAASVADPNPLFSVTNTFNGFSMNNMAIVGRRLTGSGFGLNFPRAIWGDAYIGIGLMGTSYTHAGVYGQSEQEDGVYGTSNGSSAKAGVYGFGSAGAAGVRGEIEDNSIAVHGKTTGADAVAGKFENTYATNDHPAVIVSTNGIGRGLEISSNNASAAEPAIHVTAIGNSHGITIAHSGGANTKGLNAQHSANGTAVYGKSHDGIPANFEITNPANSFPALLLNNHGFGTTLSVFSHQTGVTGPGIGIFSLGLGGGITSETAKGKSGVFRTLETTAPQENLEVTTIANQVNAIFNSNHTTSTKSNVIVNQNGAGRGVEIKLSKPASNSAGLYVETKGSIGVQAFCAEHAGAVAISGTTGQSVNSTIAIRGETGDEALNCIGILGEAGVNDEEGIGVKGISHSVFKTRGAVTGINMSQGVGVYGESRGSQGVGVFGVAGNTAEHTVAGAFRNNYTENNKSVVEIYSSGKGNGLLLESTNVANSSAMIHVDNKGTGPFLRLEGNLGDVTTIAKNGDITTDGNIFADGDIATDGELRVNGNFGIVRSSNNQQLRVETLTVVYDAPEDEILGFGEKRSISVTFSTPFAAAPAVYVANITEDEGGLAFRLMPSVKNVNTTGCLFQFMNPLHHSTAVYDTSWKIVAMGVE